MQRNVEKYSRLLQVEVSLRLYNNWIQVVMNHEIQCRRMRLSITQQYQQQSTFLSRIGCYLNYSWEAADENWVCNGLCSFIFQQFGVLMFILWQKQKAQQHAHTKTTQPPYIKILKLTKIVERTEKQKNPKIESNTIEITLTKVSNILSLSHLQSQDRYASGRPWRPWFAWADPPFSRR